MFLKASPVWRQNWTITVAKETPDVTYHEENGDVVGMLNCHFTLTWPNLLYPHTFFDWPAICTFFCKRSRFHRDRWYSECLRVSFFKKTFFFLFFCWFSKEKRLSLEKNKKKWKQCQSLFFCHLCLLNVFCVYTMN